MDSYWLEYEDRHIPKRLKRSKKTDSLESQLSQQPIRQFKKQPAQETTNIPKKKDCQTGGSQIEDSRDESKTKKSERSLDSQKDDMTNSQRQPDRQDRNQRDSGSRSRHPGQMRDTETGCKGPREHFSLNGWIDLRFYFFGRVDLHFSLYGRVHLNFSMHGTVDLHFSLYEKAGI